ncbi:MAG: bifunctional N-acetylglucosamine-1-phosphate uridyltransferase/glucosamine-1-phosphate acetyltransferase [bacterium]
MSRSDVAAVVLAAGQSTRMKSKTSKMLHSVCGRPVIRYLIDVIEAVQAHRIVMVVGYQAENIKTELLGKNIEFVLQKERLGTAHAVLQTKEILSDFSGTVLILNGDTPLLTSKEVRELIALHNQSQAGATILSGDVPDPFGYGRIVRDETGCVLEIVEEKDASEEQRKVREINTGIYCFQARDLYGTLSRVSNRNASREYYLTDLVSIFRDQGKPVQALKVTDFRTALGINTRADLAEANRIMRQRILACLMADGVTVVDPHNTYIDFGVSIGRDTVIGPGSVIEGVSLIGEECFIGPFSRIINSTLEDKIYLEGGCFIMGSHLPKGSVVSAFQQIGRDNQQH